MTGSEQGLIWPRKEDAEGYVLLSVSPDSKALLEGRWDPGSKSGPVSEPAPATEPDVVDHLLKRRPVNRPTEGKEPPEPAGK
jgi:hypothetical protein